MTASISAIMNSLAECSLPGPGVTRLPFTDQHRQANAMITTLMEKAGLDVSLDDGGTLVGRRHGPEDAPTLLMGSHQDSVRNGGRFDGAMGIILPILALTDLKDIELPFAVEVLAFPDEEGVRFPTTLIGSRAIAGSFDMDVLSYHDADGISLGQAMQDFGLDPAHIPQLDRRNSRILGFVEVHLEQGPILEDMNMPVGVVTSIAGVDRFTISITGVANHAGTIPMEKRKDALVAASEMVLAVNRLARESNGGKATVGQLGVSPNAVNVIPGQVDMTLDIRFDNDARRDQLGEDIITAMEAIAAEHGTEIVITKTYSQAVTPCDAVFREKLAEASRQVQPETMELSSGAFHDASAMADLCSVGMLFVRCHEGISHHPDEMVEEEDMARAVEVLKRFLLDLDPDN